MLKKGPMGNDGMLVMVKAGGVPGLSLRWPDGRTGDPGRLPEGEPGWEGVSRGAGWRVKRKRRAGICQKAFWETNIRDHANSLFWAVAPTAESRLATKPIRSSLGSKFFPRSTPSLLMFMRHSPRGLPVSGVAAEAFVCSTDEGAGW